MDTPTIWKFPHDLSAEEGKIRQQPLIRKEAGMVAAFSFSAGQELKEHTAPYDVLVTILHGEAHIRVQSETHTLTAGNCILLPANIPHSVLAITGMCMTLTLIRG